MDEAWIGIVAVNDFNRVRNFYALDKDGNIIRDSAGYDGRITLDDLLHMDKRDLFERYFEPAIDGIRQHPNMVKFQGEKVST